MSKSNSTNSSIRLKRDHQNSLIEEPISSTKSPSPPVKKQKQQHTTNLMDKEIRTRYPNGSSSSSAFMSSNSTKKLLIKNLKS